MYTFKLFAGLLVLATGLERASAGVIDYSRVNPTTDHRGLRGLGGTVSNSTIGKRQSAYTCEEKFIDFKDPNALSNFVVEWCPQNTYQTGNSVVWKLTPECGTTMVYPHDFPIGKIEARIRMAPGSGAVTALLLSGLAPSDEIDMEWVGKDPYTARSMYFVKGQRVGEHSEGYHPVAPENQEKDMSATFHNYAIELNTDVVRWYIDSQIVRTLPRTDAQSFPSTASRPRMGIWDGSETSGWAGTVDWNQGPITAEIQWIKIVPFC